MFRYGVLCCFLVIAGCNNDSSSSGGVATSDISLYINVQSADLRAYAIVYVKRGSELLRIGNDERLLLYIDGEAYALQENYFTYAPYDNDKHYYYELELPVIADGAMVRLAFERSGEVSATNNVVVFPAKPVITNPPADTTLSASVDNTFSWTPGSADDESVSLVLPDCCVESYFGANDVLDTEYVVPAGTMYQFSEPTKINMSVRRKRFGVVDSVLADGSFVVENISSQSIWLYN